ncbi:hypothetical protein LIPSTDRAFT_327139 [Lipomyces starkeyi NRRL Y-11557]|uniref:HORMA domain-containing protein n=1 Tax=Lipomyces starkeyi NRRL Y-11557 TaxID=675824 RepID=A0A1E3Q1P3_LIPST|nr:hypothetical protein LIPSTDRAFT_327139 [Lipomyces starkeyi NRRL Y-11557]
MSTSKAQLPSWTFAEVLSAFADFLIVSIHTILYEREIYPHETFMLARKYNFPVRQSRHPQVCDWVRNAIGACMDQMRRVSRHLIKVDVNNARNNDYIGRCV